MNSAFGLISFCVVCLFCNVDAGVTSAVSSLFKLLASGNPPILSEEGFAEFVYTLRMYKPDPQVVNWWYQALEKKPTEQNMLDWCAFFGKSQNQEYFEQPKESKVDRAMVETLYNNCGKYEPGGRLTLDGVKHFVSTAFKDVTESSAITFYKLAGGFLKFDAIKICENKEESLKETYLLK